MLRVLLIAACLAISAHAYSDGAPKGACSDLTPQHGAQLQVIKPPYSLSGEAHVRQGQKLRLTLAGDEFLGFIIQARDGQNRVVGKFQVDNKESQTLTCKEKDDTLTHRKINKDTPLTKLDFEWIAPAGYKGNVKIMATVVQSSFVYWVGRVTKDIDIEEA